VIPRLIAITPETLHGEKTEVAAILSLLKDARLGILIRAPVIDVATLHRLLDSHQHSGARLIIHTKTRGWKQSIARHPHLGCHLSADQPIKELRAQIRGPIGRSCHTLQEVQRAFSEGADYTFLSPIFPPHSKPEDTRSPLGLTVLTEANQWGPTLGLGGFHPQRFHDARRANCWGAAVVGDVFSTPEAIAQRVNAYF
jgi:thiamine monophosphate synthase